jgi:hypothetical protein
MTRGAWFPLNDEDLVVWLKNFARKLAQHQAVLGLDAATVAQAAADAEYWAWFVDTYRQATANLQSWTASKSVLRNDEAAGVPHVAPGFPVPPAAPPGVIPGIVPRVRALVRRIKVANGYTIAIGEDLGIVGAVMVSDPNAWKPVLETRRGAGGAVEVHWKKAQSDGIELHVDRGNGFVFLAVDTEPDYLDAAPLPPAGQSATWTYKAIYRKGDARAGQWSDPVSQPVMG